MSDVFTQEKRSQVMSAVKSKGNRSTEIRLIALFKAAGMKGWRRNFKLFGKPDFVFPKQRIAVFADGCFWHGHHCRNLTPKQNGEYWQNKIARNKKRDIEVTETLTQKRWLVTRIWECELKKGVLPTELLSAYQNGAETPPLSI